MAAAITHRASLSTQSRRVALPGIGMAAMPRATSLLIECGQGIEHSCTRRPVDGDGRARAMGDERVDQVRQP
jgi:hypothetical protein